ncbi:MAG: polymer-forming cytoskeletal protein [Pelagibaca sp.]
MFTKRKNTNTRKEILSGIGTKTFASQSVPVETTSKIPSRTDVGTQRLPSLMSEGLEITGQVTSQGSIEINGTFRGDINTKFLTIGRTATVIGNVMADDILVHGSVFGQILGFKVRLSSTAQVEGDITYKQVSIDSGAKLNGNLTRRDPASELDAD